MLDYAASVYAYSLLLARNYKAYRDVTFTASL